MSVQDFFQALDPAARSLPDLLQTVAQGLVDRLGLARATLSIQSLDSAVTVRAKRPSRARNTASPSPMDEAVYEAQVAEAPKLRLDSQMSSSNAEPDRSPTLTLPLRHGGGFVGELRLEWSSEDIRPRTPMPWLQEIARQCAFIARRYEAQAWSAHRLGEPMLLVGMSQSLRETEAFVERAAQSELPVLLSGEFGTEKPLLAMTIHCLGPRRGGPFVEVNCADPAGEPERWFAEAEGGALFLSGVDELAPRLQARLPLHMRSRLGQWLPGQTVGDVRLIASTTADLEAEAAAGRFSRRLLAEIDVLRIAVPPLRERPGDIDRLALAALERRGFKAAEKHTEALMSICRAYSWPQNVVELERVMARLAVMTDERPIRREDVLRHAPWIARAKAAPIAPEPADEITPSPQAPPERDVDYWARCMLAHDTGPTAGLHAALRRVLPYLAEHYAEPVFLEQLARHGRVSASHLSFLFRTELKTSFKTLLLRIRIRRAEEMLAEDDRRQITEVALSVGFADLSHFEKSFRRLVGLSPREHRRGIARGGGDQP